MSQALQTRPADVSIPTSMGHVADMGVTPVNKTHALITGRISFAAEVLSVFTDQTVEQRRLDIVWNAALGQNRLTVSQLEEELKTAAKLAAEADKTAGFVPPEGAKGQEKYGPKRASMNTVASQIRQVWGALAHTNAAQDRSNDGAPRKPDITRDMGFAKATSVARACLKGHGITWDGAPAKSQEEKEQQAEAKAAQDAMATYAKEFPMRAGETIADFQSRQALAVEISLLEGAKARHEAMIDAAVEDILKKYSLEDAAMIAEKIAEKWNAQFKQTTEEPAPAPF